MKKKKNTVGILYLRRISKHTYKVQSESFHKILLSKKSQIHFKIARTPKLCSHNYQTPIAGHTP